MGMRPTEVSVSDASGGAVASGIVPVNWRQAPFQLGLQCDITGTVDYDVQYTLDDIRAPGYDPSTGTWTAAPSPFDGASADQSGAFEIPCTALRLLLNSGSGSVTMRVVSAGK